MAAGMLAAFRSAADSQRFREVGPMGDTTDNATENGLIRIRTNAVGAHDGLRRDDVWLRLYEARDEAGLTPAQLAERARVSVLTVEAIEAGAVERLPIGEPGRREVRQVCRALRLDPEPFVEALSAGTSPPLSQKLERQRPARSRSPLLYVALAWVVILAGFLAFRLAGGGSGDSGRTEPEPAPTKATTTTTTSTTTTSTTTLPPVYAVTVRATGGPSRVKVTVDGATVFSETIRKGQAKEFRGREVLLVVNRPERVVVAVDGQAIPAKAQMRIPQDLPAPAAGEPVSPDQAGVAPSPPATSGAAPPGG